MPERPLVCDTTVLLYLDRIGQLHLLRALFEPICVPDPVRLELDMGRLLRPDTVAPSRLGWISMVPVGQDEMDALPLNRLGEGERAVIAYAKSHREYLAGLDDLQARMLAEAVGLRVVGIIGVLFRAKREGLIPTVRSQLDALRLAGFRLTEDLYQGSLQLAGEETDRVADR